MLRSLATVAVVLCLLVFARCEENSIQEAKQAVVEANNAFGTALYETLIDEPGNLLISPLSLSAVMSMAWLGAKDITARELANGLQIPVKPVEVEEGFKALLTTLKSTSTVTLEIANKIYLQKGFHIKETYRKTVVNNFRSGIDEVNFSSNPEEARITINKWVEEKTHNNIKEMIQKGTLPPTVAMMAVNAIYFKGGWRKPFDESKTTSEPFYVNPSVTIDASMMHQTSHFSFGVVPELNSKVLWLKYRENNDNQQNQDTTQSMIIILPNEISGLKKVEDNIDIWNVTELKGRTKNVQTAVALPKFKIQKTIPLVDKLKQLGIVNPFGMEADFSGITDENVFIDTVLQKAFVEVTEKGTEAAASTVVQVMLMSAPLKIEEFKATHPFLFAIVDDATDVILFMGRVADPSEDFISLRHKLPSPH